MFTFGLWEFGNFKLFEFSILLFSTVELWDFGTLSMLTLSFSNFIVFIVSTG